MIHSDRLNRTLPTRPSDDNMALSNTVNLLVKKVQDLEATTFTLKEKVDMLALDNEPKHRKIIGLEKELKKKPTKNLLFKKSKRTNSTNMEGANTLN